MDASVQYHGTLQEQFGALADFDRVVKEARARFEQFLSVDEIRLVDEFSRLPNAARDTYARLFRRKFPQWVDDDGLLAEPWVRRPAPSIMMQQCARGTRGSTVTFADCLLRSFKSQDRKKLPFGGDIQLAANQKTIDSKCGKDRLFTVLCAVPKVILDPDIRAVFVLIHRLLFPFADEPTQAAWMNFHRLDYAPASRCGALGRLVQPFRDRAQIERFFAAREAQSEFLLLRDRAAVPADIGEKFSDIAECGFLLAPVINDRFSEHYTYGKFLWQALQHCGDDKAKVRRLALLLDKASPLLRSIGMRYLRWLNAISVALKSDTWLQARICAYALSHVKEQSDTPSTDGSHLAWNPEVDELSRRAVRLGVENVIEGPAYPPIIFKEMRRPRRENKRARVGQRVHYVGHGSQSVEEVALDRYIPQEFESGLHCEGGMLRRLFYVLFEDCLAECGEFTGAYENTSLALLDGRFRRCPQVREFLSTLASWSFDDLTRVLEKSAVRIPFGEPLPVACAEDLNGVDLIASDAETLAQHNVEVTEDGWIFRPLLMQCGPCIGGPLLSKIYDRMLLDWRYMTGGLPDLMLWSTTTCKAAFVEVKSEHDRLSTKQTHWLHFLHEHGAQAWVCHVRDTKIIEI